MRDVVALLSWKISLCVWLVAHCVVVAFVSRHRGAALRRLLGGSGALDDDDDDDGGGVQRRLRKFEVGHVVRSGYHRPKRTTTTTTTTTTIAASTRIERSSPFLAPSVGGIRAYDKEEEEEEEEEVPPKRAPCPSSLRPPPATRSAPRQAPRASR